MKKLLLLACLAASCGFAQPQITWHKWFDTYKLNTGLDNIVQVIDSSYTLLALHNDTFKIMHLNALGDTLWTKPFAKSLFLRCFIKTYDGGYAMLGFINDWRLIKTDSMGDTLCSKPYPQLSDPRCLIQTSDGGYALSGYQFPELIKTDSLGNVEWVANTFNGIHIQGQIECFNKEYLIYGNSGFNPACYKAALLDSTGNTKWVKGYGNVTFIAADLESVVSAVQLPDSSFILGCSIDTTTAGQYSLLKVKYDDGVITDSVILTDIRQYDYCKLLMLNDGNILIRTSGYIHKTTNNFASIWKKILPFGITSIKQTIDNGFIAGGGNVFQQTNLARIEYAKLDSLGNIYNYQGIPYIQPQLVSVYPNPASNQLTIDNVQLTNKPFTLTVYDVLGKVHLMQNTNASNIDISTLTPGLYVLHLQQDDKIYYGRFVKE
ncbi:MAG: T9SS type A sorting domain-containing protein [Bacteroidia bacterium]|nr:T9SS type A sorting domain-containing protein [Bacteroidia bacterium]